MGVILVVDDDEPVVALLCQALELAGYDVHEAMDGPAAVAATAEAVPDLVILDVMMPGLSGLEVLAQWRTQDDFRDVPVIALTAAVDAETRQACLDAGATEYLTKPFSIPDLLGRVRRLAAAHQAPVGPGDRSNG